MRQSKALAFIRFVISVTHLKMYNADTVTKAVVVYLTPCISTAHSRFSVIPSILLFRLSQMPVLRKLFYRF